MRSSRSLSFSSNAYNMAAKGGGGSARRRKRGGETVLFCEKQLFFPVHTSRAMVERRSFHSLFACSKQPRKPCIERRNSMRKSGNEGKRYCGR